VRWLPFNDQLAFRATYSESFVAPTVYDLNGPLSIGATPQINITRYDASGNSLGVLSGSRQYRLQSGSSRALNPSESRNWTVGIVWSPKAIKGFSLSADWFNIDERNLIDTVPAGTIVTDVEQKGPRSEFANRVRLATSIAGETHFNDGAPITASGQLTSRPSDEVWISNSKVNVAGAWQDGMDLKLTYKHDTGGWGRVNTTVAGTYLREYVFQTLPTTPPTNYQDGFFARGSGGGREGVFPRYRLHSRIDWSHRNWNAGLAHTYIPSLDDLTSPTPFRVANYSTFDAQVGHSFSNASYRRLRGLQVVVGVNNISNKFPPLIPSEGLQSHDINAYDPIGRFLYLQLKYKF
jgi:iron complex outermembrane receptor protein